MISTLYIAVFHVSEKLLLNQRCIHFLLPFSAPRNPRDDFTLSIHAGPDTGGCVQQSWDVAFNLHFMGEDSEAKRC